MPDTGAAFCRQCAPAGDADGEAIKRLQHAAGLNGAAPVIRRLPLGADKLTAEYKIRDTAGKLMAVHTGRPPAAPSGPQRHRGALVPSGSFSDL